MLFVREGIPSELVSKQNSVTEGVFIDINLRKKKWSISCSYNPNRENHPKLCAKSSSYENFFIVGGFNVCVKEFCMSGIFSWALKIL